MFLGMSEMYLCLVYLGKSSSLFNRYAHSADPGLEDWGLRGLEDWRVGGLKGLREAKRKLCTFLCLCDLGTLDVISLLILGMLGVTLIQFW